MSIFSRFYLKCSKVSFVCVFRYVGFGEFGVLVLKVRYIIGSSMNGKA
jgi:hypothetical protein